MSEPKPREAMARSQLKADTAMAPVWSLELTGIDLSDDAPGEQRRAAMKDRGSRLVGGGR